ncbi:hypothetical protein HPB48_018070 [Haemaphysalis longicornis]|uniref:HTH psq-type domain-containing protein n=1 Tax=Haemaphysalis longicornis TaxID=44386 RepID=A0A9J6FUP8_HAELO|nr:hypothetical protein HPB48_018070 [Haemaphysalis longicornis]
MKKALDAVQDKTHSLRVASRLFCIPKDALQRRVKKREKFQSQAIHKRVLGSKRRVLSEEQEKQLVEHILCMERALFGLT